MAIDLGVLAGGELLHERFDTRGVAPPRLTLAGHLGAGAGAVWPLGDRAFLGLELTAQTHFLSIESQAEMKSLVARFALRGMLAVGAWL
jgi:hypothetical protein